MRLTKILTILIILTSGCKRLKPAGFWSSYENQFLNENISDLGPFGGFLAIHWRAPQNSTFSRHNILEFAQNNGWECVDTLSISTRTLAQWDVSGKPSFPFSFADFSNLNNLEFKFPRWINSNAVLYRHKTGWLTVQPGNCMQTEVNGYIVISSDGSQFSIYHIWGE